MTKAAIPAEDPLASYPGYLLRRASVVALAELNRKLAEFNLRHAEFALLNLVQANPDINQSEAGRLLDVQRPNMATLVAKLEKSGLLRRKPLDRRSLGMRLTSAGRALVKKAGSAVAAYEQALIDRVPAELRSYVAPILLALWRGTVDAGTGHDEAGSERKNINFSKNRRSA